MTLDGCGYPMPRREPMSEPRWIRFALMAQNPGRKTQQWRVLSKQGEGLLGTVAWYSGWRRYCFYPEPGTLYEQDCLRDIAMFCEEQTRAYRESAKVVPTGAATLPGLALVLLLAAMISWAATPPDWNVGYAGMLLGKHPAVGVQSPGSPAPCLNVSLRDDQLWRIRHIGTWLPYGGKP